MKKNAETLVGASKKVCLEIKAGGPTYSCRRIVEQIVIQTQLTNVI
jgi:hypothetical protein